MPLTSATPATRTAAATRAAIYNLRAVRDAIMVAMQLTRPHCDTGSPADRDGRVPDGEYAMQWPIHIRAHVQKRLSPDTVLLKCPVCHYRWVAYDTTSKVKDQPWLEFRT